tara:strand:+ start:423 stop:593 length:171 start_codon:yes stop_codon:yes gene_type:complete
MKKFIIINGTDVILKRLPTLEDARHHAINVCDHSKEVIVREIKNLYGLKYRKYGNG